jgi:Spy/CpxP family protein refolding chaperone
METYKKNRLLFWILLFLVAVNLAALASFYFFFREPLPGTSGNGAADTLRPAGKQQTFRQELCLDDAQSAVVDTILSRYKEAVAPLVSEIRATRKAILDELEAAKPDSIKLNSLSEKLAGLQTRMQQENIRQYLELKKVCTPDQLRRLSVLYRDLYGFGQQENGMKNRYRRGQGGGQGMGQGHGRKGQGR